MKQFEYRHMVQFYETDLMGIVHHSNYLRFFEESRVAWAHSNGLIDYQKPESAAYFAVLETQVRHVKPAKFGDELFTYVQAKQDKLKIIFEYKTFRSAELISEGRSVHVSLDQNLKLMRLPKNITEILEKTPWTETWLLNL